MVPPRVVASTNAPLVTVVLESMAAKVSAGVVPLKSPAGTKRSLSAGNSVKEAVTEEMEAIEFQLEPLSLEYSHTPLAVFSV